LSNVNINNRIIKYSFLILLTLWGYSDFFCGSNGIIKFSFKIANEDAVPVENSLVHFDSDSAYTDKYGFAHFTKVVAGVDNQTPVNANPGLKVYRSGSNIIFDIKGIQGNIALNIYNILGQQVALLNSTAGSNSTARIIWNNAVNNLSNGVYPFRISAPNFSHTGAALLQDGTFGVKNIINTSFYNEGKKSNNTTLSGIRYRVCNPSYDTLDGSITQIIKDTLINLILKKNRNSENLVYDPGFLLKVEHDYSPDQVQFLFWDKAITGNGRIRDYSSKVVLNNMQGSSVNICSNNNGAGTKLVSSVWFWNAPRLYAGDNLNFGVYVKSNLLKSASFTIRFIDRDLNTIGTEIQSAPNSKINEYQLLKLENVAIPIVKDGDKYEGVFGVFFELEVNINGASADFAFPMVNSGSKLSAFTAPDIRAKFSAYKGLETLTQKLLSKKDVTMVYMGDSITHRYDDSQSGIDSSYSALLTKWITTKFKVNVEKRNNGGDGSWDQSAIAVYQKMGLDHNPDFILFGNCRNQSNFRYPGAMDQRFGMAESMIRRGKIKNINTDMLIWVPMYEIQDSKRDTAAYNYDQEHIRQNNLLVDYYGITTAWPHEKMKNLAERGLVSWQNWFGSGTSTVSDRIHQTQIGCYLFSDELKHVIAGSTMSAKKNTQLPSENLSPLTKDLMNITTYYPNDFGVKANSSKSGNWVADENMVSSGNLAGIPGKEYGVELGEYPQPIRTTSTNDYIEVKWTGKHFGIWFMDIIGRGDAEVIVDGVSKVFKHTESKMINTVCFPRVFTFGVGWQSLGFNLAYGDHTLRIKQKNAGATNVISVAMVVVF